MFALDSDERTRWNFIPTTTFPRNGLPMKAMTEPQRNWRTTLLKTGLSQRGYLTATSIMDLETSAPRGRVGSRARQGADDPRSRAVLLHRLRHAVERRGTWGWRVEGHHVSLHFTIVQRHASSRARRRSSA